MRVSLPRDDYNVPLSSSATFQPGHWSGKPQRAQGDQIVSPPSSFSLQSLESALEQESPTEMLPNILHHSVDEIDTQEQPQLWWQSRCEKDSDIHPGIVRVDSTQPEDTPVVDLSTTVTSSTAVTTTSLQLNSFPSPSCRSRPRTRSSASAPSCAIRPCRKFSDNNPIMVPDGDKLWQHLRDGANILLSNLSQWITTSLVQPENNPQFLQQKRCQRHGDPGKLKAAITTSLQPLPAGSTFANNHQSTVRLQQSVPVLRPQQVTPTRQSLVQKKSFQPHMSSSTTPLRLPPPPSPEELLHPSRSSVYTQAFRSSFWKEPPIAPRPPLQLPEATLWQGLWHLYDAETKKVRLRRLRQQLYGDEPDSRQVFDHPDLCNSAALTWRHAWKSHIELTCFSIENVPHIAQVVVETNGFRIDLPFNVQFLRIPITIPDPDLCNTKDPQLITIWFNSAYPRPYERPYSKFLFAHRLDQLHEDDLENEEASFEEMASLHLPTTYNEQRNTEKELLQQCQSVYHAPFGQYSPTDDGWPCYFKWVIPVSTVLRHGVLEGRTLIAPQGIFYDNHRKSPLSQGDLFYWLRGASKQHRQDPTLKFSAKVYYQGMKKLIQSGGDTTPAHILSGKMALDARLYDARTKGYRRPQKASLDLCTQRVYIGAYDDPVDLQVAITLNRREQSLLRAMEKYQSESPAGQAILRLYRGLYKIYDEELRVTVAVVSNKTASLNLSHYHLSQDAAVRYPTDTDSVFLPFVHGDDFSQPLHDYVLRTRKNLTVTRLTSSFHTSDISHTIGLPRLPNLMLSNSQLPYGARDNPTAILKLTQHAQAIRSNLTRQYLAQSNHPTAAKLLETHYKVENFVDALEPPVLQMDHFSSPVPVTFFWDNNSLTNVRILPLKCNSNQEELPYYLTPLAHDVYQHVLPAHTAYHTTKHQTQLNIQY